MNIIDYLRELAERADQYDRSLCQSIQDAANRLEACNALAPLPDGDQCAVSDATFEAYIMVDGYVYQRLDDENWYCILDSVPDLYLCVDNHDDATLIVQPVRLLLLNEAEI